MILHRSTCLHCSGPAAFVPGEGWIHEDGGAYLMRCDACGHKESPKAGQTPGSCPACAAVREWRDDHYVLAEAT